MGLKSSFAEPTSSCTDKYVNTAYDDMKVISDNIDALLVLAGQVPTLLQYLGAFADNPTERPNGNPLEAGDYYFNTVSETLRYYAAEDDSWTELDPEELFQARDEAQAAQAAAEAAQGLAETAQSLAEGARDTAITEAANSHLSAEASEVSRQASEAALDDAETALAGALVAESNAQDSESAAATSETNASSSASAALASEIAAQGSESQVSNNAASAATSASNAAASETAASSSASAAAISANASSASASSAATHASNALGDANRAEGYAEVAEDAAQLALAEFAGVMTVSEREAILAQNEEKYPASGFVNYGTATNDTIRSPINEGLFTRETMSNQLHLGQLEGSTATGTSKTNYSVTHIAGSISKILFINNDNLANVADGNSRILLPPAPDGTVIYDSSGDCRGTGKVNLNLATEIDPKYGDVPVGTEIQIKNEARARAFEGAVKNGDFRLGDNGDWTMLDATITNDGLVIDASSTGSSGANQDILAAGKQYRVKGRATVTSGAIKIFAAGGGTVERFDVGTHDIDFIIDNVGSGLFWCSRESSSTDIGVVHSIAVQELTEEVVTDRVDVATLEQFDMVAKDDEVCDMVQSQSTTFGDTDVPTVESVRPDSFFAAYDGQENIVKGRCVKWSTLTDVQKRKVAGYMKERLWVNEDGELTFTTIRQRSFAGAGNGDWNNISSIGGTSLRFDSAQNLVQAKGIKDSVDDFTKETSKSYVASNHPNPLIPERGVFSLRDNADKSQFAYKGRCFMYVLGTVSRLNQGAYHPNLNPAGAARVQLSTGGSPNGNDAFWYADGGSYGDNPFQNGLVSTSKGCFTWADPRGSISGGRSGRDEDGRFYDGIYDGGLGGFIDLRLGAVANDSPAEAVKVEAKVENGTYRGMEKLVWTSVSLQYLPASTNSTVRVEQGKYAPTVGTTLYSVTTAGVVTPAKVIGFTVTGSNWDIQLDMPVSRELNGYVVYQSELNLSVSGKFQTKDIIADPVNFLALFPNGILGRWNPVIPDGGQIEVELTRKSLVNSANTEYTDDNGASWTSVTTPINTTKNSIIGTKPVTRLEIHNYTVWAKPTKKSTNKPVYNSRAGLMGVYITCHYHKALGCLLNESLSGNINKSTADPAYEGLPVSATLDSGSKLLAFAPYYNRHSAIGLAAPNNNSPAVKVLPYQISNNGQASIGYQANELTWDGSAGSWGDDDKIKITDSGSDTFVDLNGNVNKSVVHELALPHGWTHNHARAGTQTKGVDL